MGGGGMDPNLLMLAALGDQSSGGGSAMSLDPYLMGFMGLDPLTQALLNGGGPNDLFSTIFDKIKFNDPTSTGSDDEDLDGDGEPDHLVETRNKIDDYLAKQWLLGKRKLSIQVNYGNVPLEYQYLNQYHGFPNPLANTPLGPKFGLPGPRPLPTRPMMPGPGYLPPPPTPGMMHSPPPHMPHGYPAPPPPGYPAPPPPPGYPSPSDSQLPTAEHPEVPPPTYPEQPPAYSHPPYYPEQHYAPQYPVQPSPYPQPPSYYPPPQGYPAPQPPSPYLPPPSYQPAAPAPAVVEEPQPAVEPAPLAEGK